MPRRPRTFVGFVYPFNVRYLPILRVLFHTLNAHRVRLIELFAWLEAYDRYRPFAPVPFIPKVQTEFARNQTLNLKTQASEHCSSKPSSTHVMLIRHYAGPRALLGLSPLEPDLKP